MKRYAEATWKGDIQHGTGKVSSASGVLEDTPYSYATRFEDEKGTNPEELIGAAHAGCFSMALSLELGNAGFTADHIQTTAGVNLNKDDSGFTIDKIHLQVSAKVPDASPEDFDKAAQAAKENCPVSKLMNAEISMEATLEQ